MIRIAEWARCGALLVVAACVAAVAPAPAVAACPNDDVRTQTSAGLPDCRAYEQVSPPVKNGNDVGVGQELPVFVAARNGRAFAFETLGALPGSDVATTINSYIGTRGPGGWETTPLSPPQVPSPNIAFSTFQWYAPDLDHAAVLTVPGPTYGHGGTEGYPNLYLLGAPSRQYAPLSVNAPSGQLMPSQQGYFFAGASDDLTHVVFESNDALTPDAPPTSSASFNVYEWDHGALRLVSILPDGSPSASGALTGAVVGAGGQTQPIQRAMSADGSRIFFGSIDDNQIYVRIDHRRTVEVSASQRATPDPNGLGVPRFAAASADGSRVFFTDAEALTDDATPADNDLYEFDVDSGTLTNLSLGTNPSSTGQVMGVIAVSDGGAYVYFKSTAELIPGQGTAGQPNIYAWHAGALAFVGTDDNPDPSIMDANQTTSRITPDGRHLVFQSTAPLTGYDNTDAVTGTLDMEVYRYDADGGRLTCVSCRADGTEPTGASTLPAPPLRAEFDQQRSISDDGRRVFFDSYDTLVGADVNGKRDVYEAEDGALHLISSGSAADDSFFAGASASGDDAFVITRQALGATDNDNNLDVYDARVDGGLAPPAVAQPCSGDGCQGTPAAAPWSPPPGSPAVAGDGNLPPVRARAARLTVGRPTAAALRRAARTGTLTIRLSVTTGGKLSARLLRRTGHRTATVGHASRNAPRAGTMHLTMRLVRSVGHDLARRHTVKLRLRVAFSHVKTAKNINLELKR